MIFRTFDYRTVAKLASWKHIISSNVVYLTDGDNLWGFVPYEKEDNCMEVHVDMSKSCRGKEAVEKCKAVVQWIFSNTSTDRIVGQIPSHNRRACFNAVHSGLRFIGISDEDENIRLYEVRK